MSIRLLPAGLLKNHIVLMTDRSGPRSAEKLDKTAVAIVLSLPIIAGGLACWFGSRLQQPAALLAALSLLSAGLLAAFGQIATIRTGYQLPDDDYDPNWRVRGMLDEAVAHILTAALIAVSLAAVIVAGMNLGEGATSKQQPTSSLAHWASVIVIAGGTHLLLVFYMVIRELWGAYEVANQRHQENEYLH